jgi:large subunit ribosomal protein L25
MSTIKFELEAEVRSDIGKGASRRLRHTNMVPGVVYGADQDPVSLTFNHDKVKTALANEAFYSHILTLKIGKKVEKVILKDVQRDPARPRVAHLDFLRIKADQKLHMHIPLHFIGEENAPGAKEGGVFSHTMSDVEVSCLPANLPEFIEVDVSGMALNDVLHLTDLKLPKGVELVAFAHGSEGHDHPVVSIHIPRIIEEEVVEAAAEEGEVVEGEEGAEGEVKAEGEQAAETADKTKEKE